MTLRTRIRRQAIALQRLMRSWKAVAWALLDRDHVLLAHIIPIRRCNLSCKYCNEYDDHSKPVPLEQMYKRIDRLGKFGTSVITISGGEPLLHPELDDVIRRIRSHGNRAGLEYLQISIDNVQPDDVSKKSLKVLDQKLQLLAEFADFHVNINSVLG